MSLKLHFLGTGCMVPTKERNHLSVALEYEGEIFLFDCGEATQNQIKKMKLPIGKIKRIFISHWHGDHTLGLGGLVQTLNNTDNVERLEIHGPKNTKKYFEHTLKSTIFEPKIKIEVFEHEPKSGEVLKVLENSSYEIHCAKLNHSVPCIGYSFKIKDTLNVDMKKLRAIAPKLETSPMLARAKMGLPIDFEGKRIDYKDITYTKAGAKISFVFDTRPCKEIDLLVKKSDYLVMEATYMQRQAEKADEYDHMTAHETAETAIRNDVKELIITHFSQRYKDTKDIENEAREVFENTTSTYDLMTLNLK